LPLHAAKLNPTLDREVNDVRSNGCKRDFRHAIPITLPSLSQVPISDRDGDYDAHSHTDNRSQEVHLKGLCIDPNTHDYGNDDGRERQTDGDDEDTAPVQFT
jgi:hypothetical protein